MDSRPLLESTDKIGVHLDSITLEELLNKGDKLANAILEHCNSEHLEAFRSPLATNYNGLKEVVEYKVITKNSEVASIEIEHTGHYKASIFFGYKIKDIKSIAEKIFKKTKISQTELERILRVFIQAVFNRHGREKSCIYITNDKLVLKNRLWFESHFPGGTLNIMSTGEASIFLDLFFKKKGYYYARSRYLLNKGYWYWLSMRLKIPHYNVGDPMVDALANRLYFVLMALDEIGIQYYLGANNDTMDNTLYHFNYLISLVSSIFDNLALKTNTHLGINFRDLRKVSLSNVAGKEFLRKIREKDTRIRDHITAFMCFIKLIYTFRPYAIHREGFAKTAFTHRDSDSKWEANFIKIPKKARDYIKNMRDVKKEFDPFTVWGLYYKKNVGNEFYLEPYSFSMKAIVTLIDFVDKYLELLGYPSFIEAKKKRDDDFTRTLTVFEKYHLGF